MLTGAGSLLGSGLGGSLLCGGGLCGGFGGGFGGSFGSSFGSGFSSGLSGSLGSSLRRSFRSGFLGRSGSLLCGGFGCRCSLLGRSGSSLFRLGLCGGLGRSVLLVRGRCLGLDISIGYDGCYTSTHLGSKLYSTRDTFGKTELALFSASLDGVVKVVGVGVGRKVNLVLVGEVSVMSYSRAFETYFLRVGRDTPARTSSG